ncbi:hypothetical protein [Facilibium subflavum]|uniref:hypothetical protein n=1 Tax=Facilibium subflavum TaxID=2219058 RepID=UPI000E646585|nr:hypothetical protein [Facilibium subflavum]
MEFRKLRSASVVAAALISLVGCSSTSSFFRNRDFDYARDSVTQNKPLEIPKSISSDPTITPKLVMPDEKAGMAFTKPEYQQSQQALLPPGYEDTYNIAYLQQNQLHIVDTKLDFDHDNQAKLTIYEPYEISWLLVQKALENQKEDIKLRQIDKENGRFVISDKAVKQSYYVFLAHVSNAFRKTEVSLFDMNEKPVTSKNGNKVIENINNRIKGKTVTQSMLVSSGFGFISSSLGFKFQVYSNKKVASLVFVGDQKTIEKALKQAIEKAGFTYLAYDEKNKTILVKDKQNHSYLLYLYDYTQNGALFSDMSNWRNFFREEQKQLRVSVFDTKQKLLPVKKGRDILVMIGKAIPITKPDDNGKSDQSMQQINVSKTNTDKTDG